MTTTDHTQSTPSEPASLNDQRLDLLITLMDEKSRGYGKGADRALFHALKKWRACLPVLDDYFHKCFRQCDVTEDGHGDMIIWNLLDASKLFWSVLDEVNDQLPVKTAP